MLRDGSVTKSDIKVVGEQIHLLPDRTAYPLQVSTRLYPGRLNVVGMHYAL
jgi:hypothetical protein